jgi:hypothetical protein
MTSFSQKAAAEDLADGLTMRRLQFELALDMGVGHRPLVDSLKEAAATAGADLLFVLPAPSGAGITAVVRLKEDGKNSFLQITSSGDGFAIREEAGMDAALLGLARASVDVFERMSADAAIRTPLAQN